VSKHRFGHDLSEKKKENLLSGIYVGSILITLAVIFIVQSSLWNQLVDFFTSMTLAPVPGTSVALPAPSNPTAYFELYMAVFEFTITVGAIEVVVLILRVLLDSPVQRKAETIENIVFWLGTSFLIITYLVNMTIAGEWFVFWAGVILITGLAFLARSFVLLAQR
jgi:hypothetical protein